MFIKKEVKHSEFGKEFYTGDFYTFKHSNSIPKLYKIDEKFVLSVKTLDCLGDECKINFINFHFDKKPTIEEINNTIKTSGFHGVESHSNEFDLLNGVKNITKKDTKSEKTDYYTTVEFEDGDSYVWRTVYVDHFGLSYSLQGVDGILMSNGDDLVWKDFIYEKGHWVVIRKATEREIQTYSIIINEIYK